MAGLLDFVSVYIECEETLGMQCLHFIGVHRLSAFFRQICFHCVSVLGEEIITIDRLELEKLLGGNEKKAERKKPPLWMIS